MDDFLYFIVKESPCFKKTQQKKEEMVSAIANMILFFFRFFDFKFLFTRLIEENHPESLEDDFEIQTDASMLYIFDIQVNPFPEGKGIAVMLNLPEAQKSTLHQKSILLIIRVFLCLIDNRASRSDDRHISDEDIPDLGKFIQTCLSDESSEFRDSWVILQFECRFIGFIDAIMK